MWVFETIFASQFWSLRCYLSMNSFQCWRNSHLICMNSFTGEWIQTETGIPLIPKDQFFGTPFRILAFHIQMSKGQVFKIKKLKQQQQSNDVFFLRGNYFILISATLPTLSTFYVQQWSVALSQCLLMHIWFDFD